MSVNADLLTEMLVDHYSGDEVARLAFLDYCEDNGVQLPEEAVTGVWQGTLDEWLDCGHQVVREWPVVAVRFTDKDPAKDSLSHGKIVWWACRFLTTTGDSARMWSNPDGPGSPVHMPWVWFLSSPDNGGATFSYDSVEAAWDFVSKKAIEWAVKESMGREEQDE